MSWTTYFIKMYKIVLLIVICVINVRTETCVTPNGETAECISLYACPILLKTLIERSKEGRDFVRQSHCGTWTRETEPLVCCGSTTSFITTTTTTTAVPNKWKTTAVNRIQRPTTKPPLSDRRYCGYQHTDDYLYTGNTTAIDEFPWLAVFKYEQDPDLDDDFQKYFTEFGCAGTIINARYVLTAAQCLRLISSSVVAVRLGEYNIKHDVDCVKYSDLDDCSNPIEEVGIEKIIRHPKYDRRKGLNDIALLRLNRTLYFSDYIRPICLPINGTKLAKIDDTVVASGFGREDTNGVFAIIKKRIVGKIISNEQCGKLLSEVPDKRRHVNENIICSLEVNSTFHTSCTGDSGGPLAISHRAQWHIEGVAVWSADLCGGFFPFAYTKVVNYLDWIEKSIEPW